MYGPAARVCGHTAEESAGVVSEAGVDIVEHGAVDRLNPGRAVREIVCAEGDVVPRVKGNNVDLRRVN